MKILVVHEVSYLRKVIYEIHEFPELLALRGHEVTFLEFDEGATKSTLGEPRDRIISGRIHPDAKIRLVTPHRFGIAGVDRLWAIFSSIPLMLRIFSKSNFDVVLNFAVPTYAIQLNVIARMFGVPVLHRALDVSSKIRESFWNPLIHIYESIAYRLPEALSANNPAMESYLKSRLPSGAHRKIEVHYPPLDTEIFQPHKVSSALQKRLGLSSKDKVLMYMGSFFYFSGLDEVITELAPNFKSDQNLKLLLIGGGEQEPELRALVAKMGIDSQVIFTGFVPFDKLAEYMSLAKVAINPLKNSLVAGAAFPHKVLQYMATGLPTVSTKLDGLYAAFGDTAGITWAHNTQELVDKALGLLEIPKTKLKQQIKLQSETVERMFSKKATVDALEISLEKLASNRKQK